MKKTTLTTLTYLLLVLPWLAAPTLVAADTTQLHRLVEQGRILPLQQLLDYLAQRYQGQVIEIELDDEDSRWEYELELLGPEGQIAEFTFDAKTGVLLDIEGRAVALKND